MTPFDTRILVFATQADAAAAVSRISATMGLSGSTFLYAIPAQLADGRWHIPYPSDPAWLAGVSGLTTAERLGLVPVNEAMPDRPFVPPEVTNFQVRAVLMRMPSPAGQAGRTLFEDVDEAVRAAGGEDWQAWEYTSTITRTGGLVVSMGRKLGLSDAEIDQLFIAASQISA